MPATAVNVAPATIEIRNEIPAQSPPVVNVAAPSATVLAADVRVEAPPAPVVNVTV